MIVTSRAGSNRLRYKFKAEVFGSIPLLELVVRRCEAAHVKEVVVCCPDEDVAAFCEERGLQYERCDPDDRNVLRQLLETADRRDMKRIALVTGDMAVVDPYMLSRGFLRFEGRDLAFLNYGPLRRSGTMVKGIPARYITRGALVRATELIAGYQEHGVTLLDDKWRSRGVPANDTVHEKLSYKEDLAGRYNYSVDTLEDLEFVREIYRTFGQADFDYKELLQCVSNTPHLKVLARAAM